MFLTEVDLDYLDDYVRSIDGKLISYHQLTKPLKYLSNYLKQNVTFNMRRLDG